MLAAVADLHSREIYHGDIKVCFMCNFFGWSGLVLFALPFQSENVMITTWHWAVLADFANHKPIVSGCCYCQKSANHPYFSSTLFCPVFVLIF